MKQIQRITACVLVTAIMMFISCKKEFSCERCNSSTTPTANKPPIADAGIHQTVTLPKDSVLLDGSASNDPDGTILSYKWAMISGPGISNISKPDSSKTLVKSLVAGVYKFELTVKDNGGLSAKDTVQVMVDVPGNQPPVACAGADQIITLPVNSVTLDGSCSADPDNNITSYMWTFISGPTITIPNSNAKQIQLTGLVEGVYKIELMVTDAGGLFSTERVQVTVKDPCDVSTRPVLNANLVEIGRLSEGRLPAVGTAGSKIVFAGGETKFVCGPDIVTSSAVVDIYDINSHAWTTAKLSKERNSISVASTSRKVFFAGGINWEYQGGGLSSNSFFDNIDIYDAVSNSWSLAHLSKARINMSVAVAGNKVIFAGGTWYTVSSGSGFTEEVSDVVDIYDAYTNSWSTAKLSVPRLNMSTAVIGDKVYFAGGSIANGTIVNVVDVYNSSTNTWTTSTLPEDVALANSTQISNYVIWSQQSRVQIKNINTGTIISNCMSGAAFNTTGLKDNGIIFFTADNSKDALTQFDVYNTVTGSWSVGKLNQSFPGSSTASVITVNNTTYLAGGRNGCDKAYRDNVYVLSW